MRSQDPTRRRYDNVANLPIDREVVAAGIRGLEDAQRLPLRETLSYSEALERDVRFVLLSVLEAGYTIEHTDVRRIEEHRD